MSYLDTALQRIETGWRIRFDGKSYITYGPYGPAGITENASHALAYYMWRCAYGMQEPIVTQFRDFLPLLRDDDVSRIGGEHRFTLYDGDPRGP